MMRSKLRLLLVLSVIASLLVVQQLVYHLSGALTSAQRIPDDLRHLFSQEDDEQQLILPGKLPLAGGSRQVRKQLHELPDLVALKQQMPGDLAPPLAEKEEILDVLRRLANLLRHESSRQALSDILQAPIPTAPAERQRSSLAPALPAATTTKLQPPTTPPWKIPKILHQTFSSALVYDNYRALISSCLRLNPDWKYYLWTDADAVALMARHFPDMLNTVKLFKHQLEKSDALRYMVLHVMGGIYVDMDVECKKPFFPLLSNRTAFLDQEQQTHASMLYGRNFLASNAVMGASPKHPFLKQVISRVVGEKSFGSPMQSTGPGMLSDALEEYRKSATFRAHPIDLLQSHVMSPEIDYAQNWKYFCDIQNRLKNAKNKIKEHRARELSMQEEACLQLESENWRVNDTRPETMAVHKYLHLGYPEHIQRQRLKLTFFNATQAFSGRIHFYSQEQPLTPELQKLLKK